MTIRVGLFARSATLALIVALAGASAWSACGGPDLLAKGSDGDPGPTFGLEVVVAIKGRGRVVSEPASLDCPSNCSARIVFADRGLADAGEGLALTARGTSDSHFVGWTYETVDLGARARGPTQCSPMRRATAALPEPSGSPRLTLQYGETTGTAPAGLEAECAAFTTVPLAYALTATFEEDSAIPEHTAPGPPIEVLFEPPALGVVVGREIGIMAGTVYWRFDKNGASGIASGQADGKGGGSILNVQPFDGITKFHIDRHLVIQHSNGLVETIQSGTGARTALSYFSTCAALASTDANAYCRLGVGGSVTYLYSWPIGGGGYTYINTLPRGVDLAIDDENFYFSTTPIGAPGQALVESEPRFPDGGVPVVSRLFSGLISPRELAVGPDYLFWLDDLGGNVVDVNTAPKTSADSGLTWLHGFTLPASVVGLARDPTSPTTFWVGLRSTSGGPTDSSIVRGSTEGVRFTPFRAGLTGIGGIAVDGTHVYWTQSDGRVYRAPKE